MRARAGPSFQERVDTALKALRGPSEGAPRFTREFLGNPQVPFKGSIKGDMRPRKGYGKLLWQLCTFRILLKKIIGPL